MAYSDSKRGEVMAAAAMPRDWICYELGPLGNFAVFNDAGWSDEPLVDGDVYPVDVAPNNEFASMAWSADCRRYFVGTDRGIILASPGKSEALFCKRKSCRFLEARLR
jgi:hypothetical protein